MHLHRGGSTTATQPPSHSRKWEAGRSGRELSAAGHYWAARSEQMCRRPRIAPLLRLASNSPESFYGLLARETLGVDRRLPPDIHNGISRIANLPNVRRAEELKHRPALARRGIDRAPGPNRPGPGSSRVDRAGPQARPSVRAILARSQWTVWRRCRYGRSLSCPALDAA